MTKAYLFSPTYGKHNVLVSGLLQMGTKRQSLTISDPY